MERCRVRNIANAFSLIELLVVTAIIALMIGLMGPALTGIKDSTDLGKAAYDIAGTLDQARSYAMANNTFVFVGIGEFDASKDSSAAQQIPGTGRVAIAVVASKDGLRGYNIANGTLPNPAWSSYNNGAGLVAISRLQRFENLHLAQPGSLNGFRVSADANGLVNTGKMTRPAITSNYYVLAKGATVTPFAWPLGKAMGGGQYNFTTVINFDPQGAARIQFSTNSDTIGRYMEIGLVPTRGNIAPSTLPANVAAIQINGMTGATRIYRP